VTAPEGAERRLTPAGDRKRLLPNEVAAMRRPHPDDARVWIGIYLELLEACQRLMAESDPAEPVEPLRLEADRIGRRIDYWRGVAGERTGPATEPGPEGHR
jgi:hypothetical protein